MSAIVFCPTDVVRQIMPWQDQGPRTRMVAFDGGVSITFTGHLVHTPVGKVALVFGWGMEAHVDGWQWLTIGDQVRVLDLHLDEVVQHWKALTAAQLSDVFVVAEAAGAQVRVRSRK